jgi:hypothetical protein
VPGIEFSFFTQDELIIVNDIYSSTFIKVRYKKSKL